MIVNSKRILLAAAMGFAPLAYAADAPAAPAVVPLAADRADDKKGKDVVDTAVEAGKFKTLAAALKAAGLVEALKGDGPFTVFAPTDEAFAKLPKGAVEDLLKPANKEKLKAVLTYHVVAAKAMSGGLKDGQKVKTLGGKELTVKIDGKNVMIGDAKVVKADVPASNGVIHVIDTVLMP